METDSGYIYSQYRSPVRDKTYGKHKISYNGCGPVAVYNAMLAAGKGRTFDDVIAELEKHLMLGGLLGTSGSGVKKALKHFGGTVRYGSGKRRIGEMLETGRVFVVHMNNGFWILKGRHWVTAVKNDDGTISVYNGAKKDRTADYPSFDVFCENYIKSGHGSVVRLYSIQ